MHACIFLHGINSFLYSWMKKNCAHLCGKFKSDLDWTGLDQTQTDMCPKKWYAGKGKKRKEYMTPNKLIISVPATWLLAWMVI